MAILKNTFSEFEGKMTDDQKAAVNVEVKKLCHRDSYKNYMDGSNWKYVLMEWMTVLLPSVDAKPEAGQRRGTALKRESGVARPTRTFTFQAV
eukprot:SAG11_NODE_1476_length_4837_cov_6.669571_2_plen_93_part_00